MVPALTPALTKITSRLIGSFARQKHKPPNSFVPGTRSSKSHHSDPHQTEKRRLNLEENSPTHLLHGIMTKTDGMFERRESSGSGSSLVALDKRPFMIGVAGGTASGKVGDL